MSFSSSSKSPGTMADAGRMLSVDCPRESDKTDSPASCRTSSAGCERSLAADCRRPAALRIARRAWRSRNVCTWYSTAAGPPAVWLTMSVTAPAPPTNSRRSWLARTWVTATMFGTPPAARMSRMTPKTCALAGVKKSQSKDRRSRRSYWARHEGAEHGGFNLGGVWCDLLFH
jgi:hypothetical protein